MAISGGRDSVDDAAAVTVEALGGDRAEHITMSGVVVGILLAAGGGSRYGMPKILAQQGDWLRSGVRALAEGGCGDVLVTIGAAAAEMPAGARAIEVPDWSEGLGASVRAGLVAASATADLVGVVLHVVDIPDVTGEQVQRLLRACGPRADRVGRASFSGRPGHPVFVGADHLSGVLAMVSGDRGAGPYLAARDDVVDVDCTDLGTGVDHDRPDT
jgi:nicotine blue oxidoreductase